MNTLREGLPKLPRRMWSLKVDARGLVNYVKPSVGTAMEVFYAWTLGKPVVLWCAPDAVLSPWLRYHSTSIVHSLDDAVTKILEIA